MENVSSHKLKTHRSVDEVIPETPCPCRNPSLGTRLSLCPYYDIRTRSQVHQRFLSVFFPGQAVFTSERELRNAISFHLDPATKHWTLEKTFFKFFFLMNSAVRMCSLLENLPRHAHFLSISARLWRVRQQSRWGRAAYEMSSFVAQQSPSHTCNRNSYGLYWSRSGASAQLATHIKVWMTVHEGGSRRWSSSINRNLG